MLEVAKEVVRLAGKVHIEHYGRLLKVDAKIKNDIKLEVDKLSEKVMIDTILKRFPSHSILSEECGIIDNDKEYLWIVDPLDGTINYYYGIPYFCASAACYKKVDKADKLSQKLSDFAIPVCGAIYSALTNELFYAEVGKGAFLNNTKISASPEQDLKECIAVTGMGRTRVSSDKLFDGNNALAKQIRKIRCMGAAAYDIANLACGRFNMFFMRGISIWDFAASVIIASEAGAEVSAYEYEKGKWDVVVANSNVMPQLKRIIN